MYSKYAKIRDKKGITDYKVSQMSGVAKSTLSEWKKGKYTPKYDKLQKIANVLEVSVDEIMA